MKLKTPYFFIAAIILSTTLFIAAVNPEKGVTNSQVAALSGSVTDASSAEGIHGAEVTLTETGQSAITDGYGSFSISNVEPGSYTLSVRADGYQSAEQTVEVSDEEASVQIQMESDS